MMSIIYAAEMAVVTTQEEDMKARVDALESELNKAIIALSGTDFLLGNFDLHALFLESDGQILQRRCSAVATGQIDTRKNGLV